MEATLNSIHGRLPLKQGNALKAVGQLEEVDHEVNAELRRLGLQTHTKQGAQLRKLLFPESLQVNEASLFGESADNQNAAGLLRQALSRTTLIFDPILPSAAHAVVLPPLRSVTLSHRTSSTQSTFHASANALTTVGSRLSVAETFPSSLLRRLQGLDLNALAAQQREIRDKQQQLLLEKQRKEEEAKQRRLAEEKKIPKIDSIYDDDEVDAAPYELFQPPVVRTTPPLTTRDDSIMPAAHTAAKDLWTVPANYVPIVVFDDGETTATTAAATTSSSSQRPPVVRSDHHHAESAVTNTPGTTPTAPSTATMAAVGRDPASVTTEPTNEQETTRDVVAATILKFVRPLRPLPTTVQGPPTTTTTELASTMTVSDSWLEREDPVRRLLQRVQRERQQLLMLSQNHPRYASSSSSSRQRKSAGIVGTQNVLSALSAMQATEMASRHTAEHKKLIHRDVFGVSQEVQDAEAQEHKAKRTRAQHGDSFGVNTQRVAEEDEEEREALYGGDGRGRMTGGASDEEDNDVDDHDHDEGDEARETVKKRDRPRGFMGDSWGLLGKDAVLVYGGDDSDEEDGGDYGGGGGKKRAFGGSGGRGGGRGGGKRRKTS